MFDEDECYCPDDGWRVCERCGDGFTDFDDGESGVISCSNFVNNVECDKCWCEDILCNECYSEAKEKLINKECFNEEI